MSLLSAAASDEDADTIIELLEENKKLREELYHLKQKTLQAVKLALELKELWDETLANVCTGVDDASSEVHE